MTLWEYHLARQGYEQLQKDVLRREAGWMALILNTQYQDAKFTAGSLLGEAPPKVNVKLERKKAEKRLARKLAKSAARLKAHYAEVKLTPAEFVRRIGAE
jgi:hypothetical protein